MLQLFSPACNVNRHSTGAKRKRAPSNIALHFRVNARPSVVRLTPRAFGYGVVVPTKVRRGNRITRRRGPAVGTRGMKGDMATLSPLEPRALENRMGDGHRGLAARALTGFVVGASDYPVRFTSSKCSQAITHSSRWLSTSSFSTTMPYSGRLWARLSEMRTRTRIVSPMNTGFGKRSFSYP